MRYVCKNPPGGERNPYQLIDYLAWDRNVAWWTVSLLFLKPFTKSENNRSQRVTISC